MLRTTTVFLLALPIAIGAAPASASDNNPLGLYLGGGAGHADVRAQIDPIVDLDESATGWKALIGLRPIRMLGAELEYVDFGHPRSTAYKNAWLFQSHVLQRATGLSGLVYLPIPVPLLDIYGRVGLARLQSSGDNRYRCLGGYGCPAIVIPPLTFNRTDIDLLYGAGLQAKLQKVAVRLEYERIHDHEGDPDMVSLGLTWTF